MNHGDPRFLDDRSQVSLVISHLLDQTLKGLKHGSTHSSFCLAWQTFCRLAGQLWVENSEINRSSSAVQRVFSGQADSAARASRFNVHSNLQSRISAGLCLWKFSSGILSEVSILFNKLNQIYLMDLNIYQVEGHQVRSGRQHKFKWNGWALLRSQHNFDCTCGFLDSSIGLRICKRVLENAAKNLSVSIHLL